MSTAAKCQAIDIDASTEAVTSLPRVREVDARTRALLYGAIVPTLLRLAWPNVLIMLAQASTGLIETWWVSHLGTDALAGMALVFPVVMLMQMISAGAMGGGISSLSKACIIGPPTHPDSRQRHLRPDPAPPTTCTPHPACRPRGRVPHPGRISTYRE